MLVVYSSSTYHVVGYPGGGYELIKRHPAALTFMRGDLASAFRQQLTDAIAEDDSTDSIDEFLAGFDPLLTQPAVYH
jgi:viroplasmin and RNaseH domain-containing protein